MFWLCIIRVVTACTVYCALNISPVRLCLTVTIESATFPNVFLRMDGRGVDHPTDNGAGIVNCQYGASSYEKFILKEIEVGVYTIESATFPNVFLRMDGRGVDHPTDNGAGIVNCQYGAASYEKFILKEIEVGVYTIESATFPNVFLRMDGRGVDHATDNGAGIVNCQYGAASYEKFKIHLSL